MLKAEAASAAQPHNGILMMQAQHLRAILDGMEGKEAAPKRRRRGKAKAAPVVESGEAHAAG